LAPENGHKFNHEVAVLAMLYHNPGSSLNTYGLVQMLYPRVSSVAQHKEAFNEIARATEELIKLDLVKGTRLRDGGGRIFCSDLALTRKGKRKTIELLHQPGTPA